MFGKGHMYYNMQRRVRVCDRYLHKYIWAKDKHKQKLGVGDVPYTAEKVPYFYIQAKARGHHLPLVDFANAAMLLGSMTKGPLV